jgi:hypothetical protein
MDKKKITGFVVLFFFLFTLAYGETGWVKFASASKKSTTDCTDSYPDPQDEEPPADAEEEDTTSKTREVDDREIDEYESSLNVFFQLPDNPLLNAQYTFQHLIFKEHFLELSVPPPRG